ncbi:hypothetical protein K474DRAFT_1663858 [Panus rudis PR-1116 ss-1]|nr:hypothetical protein K474DRAFT_1663858 [Panus rudis PR-1116 ss-1]
MLHQAAIPRGYPYIPISQHVPPSKPAREYSFKLNPFQQTAIHAIQRNESVLVSVHIYNRWKDSNQSPSMLSLSVFRTTRESSTPVQSRLSAIQSTATLMLCSGMLAL